MSSGPVQGVIYPLWTGRYNIGAGNWGYVKYCFQDGFATSGTTYWQYYNTSSNNMVSNLSTNRNYLQRLVFIEYLSGATNHPMYYDNIRIWDKTLYGINPPIASSVSNFSVTSKNTWDNSNINIFNLTMKSGTTQFNFSTTTGIITTNVLSNSTSLWNLTYSANENYFNITYQNINVSSNHQGNMNQSIITLTLRNIVDNSTISNFTAKFNTTMFCNTTTSSCVNYPLAGNYQVNITPNDGISFHYPSSNINITALQNNIIYLYAHEHQINITAKDIITNASINNFTINVKSLNTSYEANYTSISGLVEAFVIHNTYNITIDAQGYALYNNVLQATQLNETLIFYLQQNNGVAINIYSETNGTSLSGTSVTIYTYLNTTLIATNITSTGIISFYNMAVGNYTFRFEATNFAVKEYYVSIGNRSFQNLNAYMLQTAYSTIFTFLDEANGNTIQDVSLIIKRYINGSLQVVSSLTSDITGRVQFNYQQNTPYYFTASNTGYANKEFTLNPIIFSSYNVKLTPSTTQTYESDYSGVTITYTPKSFNNGQSNTLSFTFGSPEGRLNAYGFNVTYKGNTSQASGVNAYGSVLTTSINITGASFQDTAQVKYYYTTSDGATNTYSFNIGIIGSQSGNYTLFSNRGQTYGLGDFERILIITLIVILVVGAGTMFAGQFVGGVLGMFILGFFGYMQFISWWVTYPTMLFLFVYVVWGSSK